MRLRTINYNEVYNAIRIKAYGEMTTLPRRQHSVLGNWKIKDKKSPVLICSCGNSYIIIHEGQVVCKFCEWNKIKGADLRVFNQIED